MQLSVSLCHHMYNPLATSTVRHHKLHTNVQGSLLSLTHLQLKKETLQLTRDVLRRLFLTTLELPLIQGIAELWSHEESLQQTVEVTSHGLVHQPYKTYGKMKNKSLRLVVR